LTPVEQSLVEHVGRGEWLDLAADDEGIDETTMQSWGNSRTCRATVIREILRGRLAADPDPHGLRLRGARICDRLDLENLTTDINLELKDCLLDMGVVARNAQLASVVFTGSRLGHPTEPALDAASLTCSALRLEGVRINSQAKAGAVCLTDARIGGLFDCTGATLRNDSGPVLVADGLWVGHSMFLMNKFNATGTGTLGAIYLVGAHIGGQFCCDWASLRNDSGPALVADELEVGQGMSLRTWFNATGTGGLGTVRLLGAHIGGSLECDGAALRNNSGPALVADGLEVGQAMFLRSWFNATGAGNRGAVRLIGARIGGQLNCTGAELRNYSGPALLANSLEVGENIFLRAPFTATGGGTGTTVNLTYTQVAARFVFDSARLDHAADSHSRLAVDGLTYAGVPEGISGRDWLDLLRYSTPRYAAQPYQQLAAGCRALGDERQAREVLMAQRDDELARADTRWPERLWGKITKVTLGYGYQPWRALLFLAGVVALSCVLAVVLGAHGALTQTKATAAPGQPCTVIQRVSVGLDLNLPVGTSPARAGCGLPRSAASVTAAWLTAVGWVLRVLAWVFAALFIAGFTSAVRKT
jgi:hypothetical protein